MGIEGVPTPYGAPNAAAHIERFMGTLRKECLQNFIFVSEGHLRRTVASFGRYDNRSRPHQGISGIPFTGDRQPPGRSGAHTGASSQACNVA